MCVTWQVGGLLVLVIFMYGVLGVQLFWQVSGELLSEDKSFETVADASELLLQCITGDEWASLMVACSQPPASPAISYLYAWRQASNQRSCARATPRRLGSPHRTPCYAARSPRPFLTRAVAACSYFLSFMILARFVLSNLVVAVILQNFSSLGDLNPDVASKDDLEGFDDRWNAYDPSGSGYIPAESLGPLLTTLDKPLRPIGVPAGDTPSNRIGARRIISNLVTNGWMPETLLSGYLECALLRAHLTRPA
jgi:hypothetical protein